MSHQIIADHAISAVKTGSGGVGVAGTTYALIANLPIDQATQIASLAAAVMTTIYFAVVTVIAILKWKHGSTE